MVHNPLFVFAVMNELVPEIKFGDAQSFIFCVHDGGPFFLQGPCTIAILSLQLYNSYNKVAVFKDC